MNIEIIENLGALRPSVDSNQRILEGKFKANEKQPLNIKGIVMNSEGKVGFCEIYMDVGL